MYHGFDLQLTRKHLFVGFQPKIGRDVRAGDPGNRTGVGLERDSEITYERPNHARNLFGLDYTTCPVVTSTSP